MLKLSQLSLRTHLLLALFIPLLLTAGGALISLGLVVNDGLNAQIRMQNEVFYKEWGFLSEAKCVELAEAFNVIRNNKELLASVRQGDAVGMATHSTSAWNQLNSFVDIMFFWKDGGDPKVLFFLAKDEQAVSSYRSSDILERVNRDKRTACAIDYSPDGKVRLLKVFPIFNPLDRSYLMFAVGLDLDPLLEKLRNTIGASSLRFSADDRSAQSGSHIDWQRSALYFSFRPVVSTALGTSLIHGYIDIGITLRHAWGIFLGFAGGVMLLSMLLGVGFSVLLMRRVMQPLTNCLQLSAQIERGEYVPEQENSVGDDEIGRISRSLLEMMVRTKRIAEDLHRSEQRLSDLIAMLPMLFVEVDDAGVVRQWNNMAESLMGIRREKALGQRFAELPIPCDRARLERFREEAMQHAAGWHLNKVACAREGEATLLLDLIVAPLPWSGPRAFIMLGRDITEQVQMEVRLSQAQKLEAIGTLAAGIAHEINTPVQFIGDNTNFLKGAFLDLNEILDKWHHLGAEEWKEEIGAQIIEEARRAELEGDLDFLLQETPTAIDQILQGVMRISVIVRAMKDFSYPDQGVATDVDLNKALQDTLTIARNEYKYVADVETGLDPELPRVVGFQNELNQVFLNLVVNAAHAIAEKKEKGGPERGKITIATRREGEEVIVSIADTGTGIPAAIRERIFEPFFTTKPVGKGSGQGLAIAHAVIHGKHGGSLTVESEEGEGSRFLIRLPIEGRQEQGG